MFRGKHGDGVCAACRLRGDAVAALTTTGRNDGAAGAGAHAGAEAVLARTTAVVGLESTLALGHGTHSLHVHGRSQLRGTFSVQQLATAAAVGLLR